METEHGLDVPQGDDRTGRVPRSQRECFKAMTASERFDWWVGMLELTSSLATPEVRRRWHAPPGGSDVSR